jgi:hypothetical protein
VALVLGIIFSLVSTWVNQQNPEGGVVFAIMFRSERYGVVEFDSQPQYEKKVITVPKSNYTRFVFLW